MILLRRLSVILLGYEVLAVALLITTIFSILCRRKRPTYLIRSQVSHPADLIVSTPTDVGVRIVSVLVHVVIVVQDQDFVISVDSLIPVASCRSSL